MKHFIFLGMAYGGGDYSFVTNPRLASLLEIDYFYDVRNFYHKTYNTTEFTQADEKLARYMLGALIAMQASAKMHTGMRNNHKLKDEIARGFSILKYGRTQIFTRIIFDMRNSLDKNIALFLQKDKLFIDNFNTLTAQGIKPKTYPMFLKKDHPNWPIDYSEVIASNNFAPPANTVFGVGSGGAPLLTGFFAQSNNTLIFLTSGHWKYNRKVSIMRQKDADPFGSGPSQSLWLKNKLDIFNFSEELVRPTLKAFDDVQIAKIQAKIGDNPYSSSFSLTQRFMPWLDTALAIPSTALIAESGVKLKDVMSLKALKPIDYYYNGFSIAFGVTEDLVSGDMSNKAPGLRRLSQGSIAFKSLRTASGPALMRALFYTPLSLQDLEWDPNLTSVFSMKFGIRCSGAPIFIADGVVGIFQGPFEINNHYAGLRMVEFTPRNLALINALVTDPRGLFNIPEKDLVDLIRTHMFPNKKKREDMHDMLNNEYIK